MKNTEQGVAPLRATSGARVNADVDMAACLSTGKAVGGEDNFFVAEWTGRGQEADPDPSG